MIIYILIYFLIVFYLNEILSKKNFLRSNTGHEHQLFVNKSVPLSGGIIFLMPFVYLLFDSYKLVLISYFFLFILGFLADLNYFTSSKKRFFFQFIIIFIFINLIKLEVLPTRITAVDNFLQDTYISYIFTIFCFLVLINGSNFIDGLNGLLIGYISIVLFYLYKTSLILSLGVSNDIFWYILILFLFILFLNFSNKLFLGDSGAYSLSFLLGFILIKIYNLNNLISPYFIILLLWYPCFENLFSIIRKFVYKSNPLNPDSQHLHQYLFSYIKKKFNFGDLTTNNLSSLIINIFNFFIFFIAASKLYHTKIQLFLLAICILTYVLSYKILKKKQKLFKKK